MSPISAWLVSVFLALGLVFTPHLFAVEPDHSESLSQPIAGTFNLINQDGQQVTESSYDGYYRLVFFGFTHCPDICPTTLLTVGRALSELGDDSSDLKPIFISVDYEQDTPEQIKNYLSHFHPSFDGLTGTEQQIRTAAAGFNTTFGKSPTTDGGGWYHSSYLYLMDKEGKLMDLFSHAVSADVLAQELRPLIQ